MTVRKVTTIPRCGQATDRVGAFLQRALSAREEVAQNGLVLDGDKVLSYVSARLTGRAASRPRKRKL